MQLGLWLFVLFLPLDVEGAGATRTLFVVTNPDDPGSAATVGALRQRLTELPDQESAFRGVAGLQEEVLAFDQTEKVQWDHCTSVLGLGLGDLPYLGVARLDAQGQAVEVLWGTRVTEVDSALSGLLGDLGARAPVAEKVNAKDGTVLVRVPAGSFRMGSEDGRPDEKPVHEMTLPEYWIGKTEVTNEQFRRFVAATGYRTTAEETGSALVWSGSQWVDTGGISWRTFEKWGPRAPVGCVSWDDAQAYCRWAGLRLPSEAEWEKAARGTDGRRYPWGNSEDFDSRAWCSDNSGGKAHEVGTKLRGASPYGCLDMAGNAAEWCADWYDRYPGATDPVEGYGTKNRVLRGGAWGSDVMGLGASHRSFAGPGARLDVVGFRCSL